MTGTTQEFCVRWNSHLGSIGAAFPQLLAVQRFVDVTLVCQGHQLRCHRLVLAACSNYFETILAENPCKHPIIILPREVKLWEIQALVDFMYKGEVNVTQAGLGHLLRCAEHLQIRGLYGSDIPLSNTYNMELERFKNADSIEDSIERVSNSEAGSGLTSLTVLSPTQKLSVKRHLLLTPKVKENESSHRKKRYSGLNNSFHIASKHKKEILPIKNSCSDEFCASHGNYYGKLCGTIALGDKNMSGELSHHQARFVVSLIIFNYIICRLKLCLLKALSQFYLIKLKSDWSSHVNYL